MSSQLETSHGAFCGSCARDTRKRSKARKIWARTLLLIPSPTISPAQTTSLIIVNQLVFFFNFFFLIFNFFIFYLFFLILDFTEHVLNDMTELEEELKNSYQVISEQAQDHIHAKFEYDFLLSFCPFLFRFHSVSFSHFRFPFQQRGYHDIRA